MKRKLLWAGGGLVASLVVACIGLSLVVKSYLTSDRLKTLILPRVEEITGRKTSVDRIDVSLFKGIAVRGIVLMERDGKQEFVNVKEFILEYRLLPLLQKKLVIKNVELVSPSFKVVREKNGRFNFADILDGSGKQPKGAAQGGAEEKGLPLAVETDKISVRDARVTLVDTEDTLPAITLVADIDLRLAAERGAARPEVSGKVMVKELTIKSGRSEIKSTGSISIKKDAADFILTAAVAKETIRFSGNIKDYMKKPVVRMDIAAAELDLEKLMAISEGTKKTTKAQAVKHEPPPQREKRTGKEEKTAGLTASGEVKVGAAKHSGYVLKDLSARYSYSDGTLAITPISTSLSGGKETVVQGTAKGELRFSLAGESAAESIEKTLAGKLTADLSKCEVIDTKISNAIALFTGIEEFSSPKFEAVHFLLTIGSGKISLDGTMTSSLVNLNPSGTVMFDKKIDVIADLKVAPSLGGRIVSSQVAPYIKDEKGWTIIPLRITGTTEKPAVGLNAAGVGKQVEEGVKQEMEKQLFKGIFGK
jgi:hypothetical protein